MVSVVFLLPTIGVDMKMETGIFWFIGALAHLLDHLHSVKAFEGCGSRCRTFLGAFAL
jgi:hypothetical protein